jgi:hypothetical protein
MTNGFRNVAQRITNAENAFVAFAMETAGLTKAEAERALAAMRKGGRKAPLKIDAVMGSFTFIHGVFAEPDVLRRAAQS